MTSVLKANELRFETRDHVISIIADGRTVVQFYEPKKIWVRLPSVMARIVLEHGVTFAVTEEEYKRR